MHKWQVIAPSRYTALQWTSQYLSRAHGPLFHRFTVRNAMLRPVKEILPRKPVTGFELAAV